MRKVPGFETLDPTKEVLHSDKPGAGLVNTHIAFSMKLGLVTRDKRGLVPSKIDPEFCCRWGGGELTCIMMEHVDDLKLAGKPEVDKFFLAQIQKVFGELKILRRAFTNFGVRRLQDTATKEITLDQIAFEQNLSKITHPEFSVAKNDDQ